MAIITQDNYQYLKLLEDKLFAGRIRKVKQDFAEIAAETSEWKAPLRYKGTIYNLSFMETRLGWSNPVEVNEDSPYFPFIQRFIQIEEHTKELKQIIRQLTMKFGSTYKIQYAMGDNDGDYLDDWAKVEINNYIEERPDIQKFFKRLRLMADMVK